MIASVCYAVISCVIWGFVFIIPSYLSQFSSVEITLGRYFFYSLSSIFFLLLKNLNIPKYPLSIWLKALTFSLITTVLYYFFLVASIKYSSPIIPILMLALSPIVSTIYGSIGQGFSKLKPLILPMTATFIGLVLVNYSKILNLEISYDYMWGIMLCMFPLGIWSWFIVANSNFLQKNPEVVSDWGSLIGSVTILWVILLSAVGFLSNNITFEKFYSIEEELWLFLGGSAALGIICSFCANNLWNFASFSLPVLLAAQLTVLETIFGVIYVYLMENRMPQLTEALGIILILAAVFYGITFYAKEQLHASCFAKINQNEEDQDLHVQT